MLLGLTFYFLITAGLCMAWILRSEPGNPDEKQMEGVRTQSDTTATTTTTASCI